MYPYVSRMLLVCYSYVTRMYPYVPYVTRMLLVCYSYVTRMYSCGVLVMILNSHNSVIKTVIDPMHRAGVSTCETTVPELSYCTLHYLILSQ